MRTFRLIGMTLLMIMLTVNFTACSDDEEDTSSYSTDIVGVWTIVCDEGWEIDDNGEKDSWKEEDADLFLKFYEDGTGTHADDQDFNPFTSVKESSSFSQLPTNKANVLSSCCSSSSSLHAVKFTVNMTINKVIPINLNVLILN